MVKQLDDLSADLEPLLCTRCVRREAGLSGFCDPCLGEHVAEDYAARDAVAISTRREAWSTRTKQATDLKPATRERQRRHRLLVAVRPKEPPPPEADPWELARAALQALARVRAAMTSAGNHRCLPELETAAELVRQLAWGPAPLR